MKRGLKYRLEQLGCGRGRVKEDSPMKRGLKSAFQLNNVRTAAR